MKFSIITPSLNQGRFLRDCIESVRAQTEVEHEHIVADGGSTDETLALLRSYPHLQWLSEPDRGMSEAINKGFRRATGDWLMWLNTDDYLLPGALAAVRQFATQHPEADVIYGDCHFVDEQGRLLREKREGEFDLNMLLFYGCYIQSTATFYRRPIIQRGYLLDESCRVCMDFEYYLRLAHAGFRFRHLPRALACFRWHGDNLSRVQAQRRYAERLQIQRDYLAKTGRAWLGREWLLRLLGRAYQVKRGLLRVGRRRREGVR